MTIEERKNINTNIIQNLILENRNKLSISGVLDVLSFDDKIVILETNNLFTDTSITVPMARVLNELLPITEYHNRWKSLKKEDFFGKINYTATDVNKGYYYVGKTDPADDSDYMTLITQGRNDRKRAASSTGIIGADDQPFVNECCVIENDTKLEIYKNFS